MADYRLTDRAFSREWRRNKTYSEREIRWLAKRRGLEFVENRDTIQVRDLKTKKVVANFGLVPAREVEPERDERSRSLAALRNV